MIETPNPSDPLTAARLVIRVLWCAAAADAVLFDAPRIRLEPGGRVYDEMGAAAALLALPPPVALAATADGDVLDVRASAASGGSDSRSWVFDSLDVRDPDAPSIVAWTAGRGLRVSQRTLKGAADAFRIERAGFMAAYNQLQLVPELADNLGVAPEDLEDAEWVVLAGRPQPPGSPPGGSAPLRRVSRPELA